MRGGGHGEGHGGLGHGSGLGSASSNAKSEHSAFGGPGGFSAVGARAERGAEAQSPAHHEPSAISRAAAEAYSPAMAGKFARREAHVEEVATRSFTSQLAGAAKLGISLKNNDCGPSSLATAMKALGVMSLKGSYESQINEVREQMTGMDNHMQGTSIGQVASVGEVHGLKATTIGGLKAINKALAQHGVVVEGGQPTHVVAGVNFQGTQTNKVNAIGHFVTVLGYNPVAKTYTVDNSEKPGPTEVSRAQMRAFVTRPDGGFYSGVALSRSKPGPSASPQEPAISVGPRAPENTSSATPKSQTGGGESDFEMKIPFFN